MWGLYRLFLFILTSLLILDTAISIHLPRPSRRIQKNQKINIMTPGWHLELFSQFERNAKSVKKVVKIFLFCNLYILNTPPTHTQVTKAVTRYKREISIKLMNIILQCFTFSKLRKHQAINKKSKFCWNWKLPFVLFSTYNYMSHPIIRGWDSL